MLMSEFWTLVNEKNKMPLVQCDVITSEQGAFLFLDANVIIPRRVVVFTRLHASHRMV